MADIEDGHEAAFILFLVAIHPGAFDLPIQFHPDRLKAFRMSARRGRSLSNAWEIRRTAVAINTREKAVTARSGEVVPNPPAGLARIS
jgi:hypothetical protein